MQGFPIKIEKTDGKSEEEKNDLLERREIVITCQGTKGGNLFTSRQRKTKHQESKHIYERMVESWKSGTLNTLSWAEKWCQ